MKILLANPNTSQSVTDQIAAVARQAAAPGTQILAVTAASGVPYIASRAEAVIAGRTTLELMAQHAPGCDAAIVVGCDVPDDTREKAVSTKLRMPRISSGA